MEDAIKVAVIAKKSPFTPNASPMFREPFAKMAKLAIETIIEDSIVAFFSS